MLGTPFPGGFANNNPRAVVIAGAGFFRAGPDGLISAHFAWADASTGLVSNTPAAHALLGLVQPTPGYWRWATTQGGRIIRPGIQVTLFAGGDFWVRFRDGAEPGALVYASPVDGAPLAGETDGAILTPWSVVTAAAPGGLAVISTWSKYQ